VEEFKYLGTTLTDQNSTQEEIKSRMESGNACCHSVQNLLSSSWLSKNIKIKIYITVILPFVLYRYENWSLTLRKEHRLRVFENWMLRRIFGPKRDKITGDWRKLHREELNDVYSSPNIVQLIKSRSRSWAGYVARLEERGGVYRVLLGKPEGKGQFARPRCRWEDNIKMDLKEVGCGGMDWTDLAEDRDRWRALVNAVMSLRVP